MSEDLLRSAEQRISELENEVERMRPVVEAACEWRHSDGLGYAMKLGEAVDAYEKQDQGE